MNDKNAQITENYFCLCTLRTRNKYLMKPRCSNDKINHYLPTKHEHIRLPKQLPCQRKYENVGTSLYN